MTIGTNRNPTYGAQTGTNKYSPLMDITFESGQETEYSRMLLNRWTLFNTSGLLPQPLSLALLNWTTAVAGEARKQPPLVVISSNRSQWIRAGILAADAQPKDKKPFRNCSDVRALTADNGQTVSPTIYAPSRNGGIARDRSIYVVVHIYEYETYQKNLADKGINVVGWSFRVPRSDAPRVCGFGASRYAAIEFCKELRRAATPAGGGDAPWDFAWLLDDNLIALSNFPGFLAVEKALREASTTAAPHVAAGFKGDTKIQTFDSIRTWARGIVDTPEGRQAPEVPPASKTGLLQQAVLWNIKYLTNNKLNFAPAFIASAEDMSISKYFDKQKTRYLFYTGITAQKEQYTNDNSPGSQLVREAREKLTAFITEMEADKSEQDPPPALPPPIRIAPKTTTDGGPQTLAKYVIERVLTRCAIDPGDRTVAVENTAKCHAAEQITSGAIAAKFVSDDALNNTFKINGTGAGAAQVIVQSDRPVR
jgi:hypothetical protein